MISLLGDRGGETKHQRGHDGCEGQVVEIKRGQPYLYTH